MGKYGENASSVPWLLHQAARALGRDDACAALELTRRALSEDPELIGVPHAEVVRAAVPELERRALAQSLALALDTEPPVSGVLADAVEALAELPDGQAILTALAANDVATVRMRLEELCERADLSPRLAHHLALLMQRQALSLEQRETNESAAASWRHAWLCWLCFLGAKPDKRAILLDWLLTQHRRRLNDLLARDAVEAARHYANLLRALPTLAAPHVETLSRDLAARLERFWDELATDHLLAMREAMRHGEIPEGWRSDYEKGLRHARRLLSLDRDNPRLLTAVVEICTEWFLDLYHQNDPTALRKQLERFTPFASQLARNIDERPSDWHARAALSDFWTFRGLLATDRERKAALYREALRFNPANPNPRDLLAAFASES